jgi:hypothetical protein
VSRIHLLAALSRRQLLLIATLLVAALATAAVLQEAPTRVQEPIGDHGGDGSAAGTLPERGALVDDGTAPTYAGGRAAAEGPAVAGSGEGGAFSADGSRSVMPSPTPLSLPGIEARIVRTGAIELRVRAGGFDRAWGDAQAVAAATGGIVAAASRSGTDDGPRSGTITLRVPSAKFEMAVERLRELPRTKVQRLDVASQDVTQEFVDVRSRLRHDRAVEGRLLALLAETRGVSEVLAVQARLDQVQQQIEVSRGRLAYLDSMTTMSTIELSLAEPAAERTADRDRDGSVLGASLREAAERFVANVAAAVVWLGGALPALLLLAAAALGVRMVLRRRRRPGDDIAAR